MALQILRQQNPANQIGESFGSGLGSGLQNLAQMKFNEMQQRQLGQQLEKAGFPALLSQLDPRVQAAYLREYGARQQGQLGQYGANEQIGPQQNDDISTLLHSVISGGRGPQASQQMQNELSPLQQLLQPQQQMPSAQNMQTQQPVHQQSGIEHILQALQQQLSNQPNQQIARLALQPNQQTSVPQHQAAPVPSASIANPVSKEVLPKKEENESAKKIVESFKPADKNELKKLSPGAKAAEESEAFEKKLNSLNISDSIKEAARERLEKRHEKLIKQQDKIDDATKDYYDDLLKQNKGAIEGDIRLGRIQELIDTGNLNHPITFNFLDKLAHGIKGVGLDLKGGLLSPESQELENLSTDFLRNAKDYFGNRITQQEVNIFLKTIPSLTQSDEGKERVIRNMHLFNEVGKTRYETAQQIIERNKGFRPHDLAQQVEQQVKPLVNDIAQRFKRDIRTAELVAKRQAENALTEKHKKEAQERREKSGIKPLPF